MAWISVESRALTLDEMGQNALEIWSYFKSQGWSINGCAAMLGNMQGESTINPGRWQNNAIGNNAMGFGLVQWTPATNYTNWASANGYARTDGNGQVRKIREEQLNGGQWYKTSTTVNGYPPCSRTFDQFATSTDSVRDLALCFMRNYERPDLSNNKLWDRQDYAEYWLAFLQSHEYRQPTVDSISWRRSGTQRQRIDFTYTASSDSNLRITRVDFALSGSSSNNQSTTTNASNVSGQFDFTYPNAGNKTATVRITVTDSQGQTATRTETFTFYIYELPSVSLSYEYNEKTKRLTVTANGKTDTSLQITNINMRLQGGVRNKYDVTATNNPNTSTTTLTIQVRLTKGIHEFTATANVTDNGGLQNTASNTISFTIEVTGDDIMPLYMMNIIEGGYDGGHYIILRRKRVTNKR